MAYQVYFAELEEENKALMLTILKLKEEADALEPGEAELLFSLRGTSTPTALPPEEPSRQRSGGGGGNRRGSGRRGGGQRPHSGNGGGGNSGGSAGNSGGGSNN